MTLPAIKAVIFDVDGLLLDTEVIYSEAMRTVMQRYGKTFDDTFKASVIGRPAMEVARHTVDTLGLPITPQAYLDERNAILEVRFADAQAKPGAIELVRHLHGHGVPIAVATSSGARLLALKTAHHADWFGHFDHIVSVEDPAVARGKPAPDVFLVTADRLGVVPRDCLVFEDSPAGVEAALAAGMQAIAVPEPQTDRAHFPAAAQFIEQLGLFRPQDYGLPAR